MKLSKSECRELVSCVVLAISQDSDLLNEALKIQDNSDIAFYREDINMLRKLEKKLKDFVEV